jgi:hypothetical protein
MAQQEEAQQVGAQEAMAQQTEAQWAKAQQAWARFDSPVQIAHQRNLCCHQRSKPDWQQWVAV